MKLFVLAVLVLAAAPAAAYLEQVTAPPTAVTGEAVQLWVVVGLPDSCWDLQGHTVTMEGLVATVDYELVFDSAGGGCLPMIVPVDFFPELVFGQPGTWTVRVVEHREGVPMPLPGDTWEGTVEVTGQVPAAPVGWGGIKARYR